MRTINKILGYTITPEQISHLRRAGIFNWIWGEGKNIEAVLRANIELIPGYSLDKAESLFNDIYMLSISHDAEYFFKLGFYRANFRFAKWVFQLLHWSSLWKRVAIFLITIILLNKYGKEHYNSPKWTRQKYH